MLDFRKAEDQKKLIQVITEVLMVTGFNKKLDSDYEAHWQHEENWSFVEIAGFCFTHYHNNNRYALEKWVSVPATQWEPEDGYYCVVGEGPTDQKLINMLIETIYDQMKETTLVHFQCAFNEEED